MRRYFEIFSVLQIVFTSTTAARAEGLGIPQDAAPLDSARCARALVIEDNPKERTALGAVTAAEYARIASVPRDSAAIRSFLDQVFPGPELIKPRLTWQYQSLWRRIPEVKPPEYKIALMWDEKLVESEWRAFLDALSRVAVSTSEYQPIARVRIYTDPRVTTRLSKLDPAVLAALAAVPMNGPAIYHHLNQRFGQNQRLLRNNLGSRLNKVWEKTLGTARTFTLVKPNDAYSIEYDRDPGAERRLVDEWRVLMMMIHRNSPRVLPGTSTIPSPLKTAI